LFFFQEIRKYQGILFDNDVTNKAFCIGNLVFGNNYNEILAFPVKLPIKKYLQWL
jgi:hypothetical protein